MLVEVFVNIHQENCRRPLRLTHIPPRIEEGISYLKYFAGLLNNVGNFGFTVTKKLRPCSLKVTCILINHFSLKLNSFSS